VFLFRVFIVVFLSPAPALIGLLLNHLWLKGLKQTVNQHQAIRQHQAVAANRGIKTKGIKDYEQEKISIGQQTELNEHRMTSLAVMPL